MTQTVLKDDFDSIITSLERRLDRLEKAPAIELDSDTPPTGAAGGVLGGTYPNPTFAADMATQAELNSHASITTAAHGGIVSDADARLTNARAPTGAAGGDLSGTYPNPTVYKSTGDFAVGDDLTVAGGLTVANGLVVSAGTVTLPANSLNGSALMDGSITANMLNIIYGGGNQAYNSSFEAAPVTPADPGAGAFTAYDGWTVNGGTASVVTAAGAGVDANRVWGIGSNALKVTATVAATLASLTSTTTRRIAVQEGRKYTASAYVGATRSGRTGGVGIRWHDSGGSIISTVGPSAVVLSTTGMTRVYALGHVAPSGAVTASPRPYADATGVLVGDAAYFDGISLEAGEYPTAYAPRSDEILPGSITATMLQASSVYADAMVANFTITGKRIQTAVSPNARVVLEGDSTVVGERGLFIYNSSNVKRLMLGETNGLVLYDTTGTQKVKLSSTGGLKTTGASGAIVVDDSGLTGYNDPTLENASNQVIRIDRATGKFIAGPPSGAARIEMDRTSMRFYKSDGTTVGLQSNAGGLTTSPTDPKISLDADGLYLTDASGNKVTWLKHSGSAIDFMADAFSTGGRVGSGWGGFTLDPKRTLQWTTGVTAEPLGRVQAYQYTGLSGSVGQSRHVWEAEATDELYSGKRAAIGLDVWTVLNTSNIRMEAGSQYKIAISSDGNSDFVMSGAGPRDVKVYGPYNVTGSSIAPNTAVSVNVTHSLAFTSLTDVVGEGHLYNGVNAAYCSWQLSHVNSNTITITFFNMGPGNATPNLKLMLHAFDQT